MKRVLAVALLLFFCGKVQAQTSNSRHSHPNGKQIVAECVAGMGGQSQLQNVKTLTFHSLSHTFLRSISSSDSLPGLFAYETKEVTLQPQLQLIAETSHWQWTESEPANVSSLTIGPEGGFVERNGKRSPVTPDKFYAAIDALAANPISALLSASAAPELKLDGSSTGEYRISFPGTVYQLPIETTLGIDKITYQLRWAEIKHSYSHDIYNAMWGDQTKRFDFSSWYLDPSGVSFPTKWKLSTGALEEGQISLLGLKINPEPPVALAIPEEFKNSFDGFLHQSAADLAKRNLGNGDHLEIQPGMVMLPGKERAYNSLIVRQDKGIMIVEGPHSNANSEQVLAYARSAFPNTPVLGVVSTDYFGFHVAGLPAYAREHVPIYVLDENVDLVRRMLSSNNSERKSTERKSGQLLHPVQNRLEIGSGVNRMALLPFRTSTGARMMAVYFRDAKLLYCSDMFLPMAWAHQYWAEHLSEIRDLIEREKLDVQSVAGVSAPPQNWKDLNDSLPPKPGGSRLMQ